VALAAGPNDEEEEYGGVEVQSSHFTPSKRHPDTQWRGCKLGPWQ